MSEASETKSDNGDSPKSAVTASTGKQLRGHLNDSRTNSGTPHNSKYASIKIKTSGHFDVSESVVDDIALDTNSMASHALENVKNSVQLKKSGLFSSRAGNVQPVSVDGYPSKGRSSLIEVTESITAMVRGNNRSRESTGTIGAVIATSSHREVERPKVEGREIKQDHDLYALCYGMMLGIRVMLRRTEFELRKQREAIKHKLLDQAPDDEHVVELREEDYKEDVELVFPPEGSVAHEAAKNKNKANPVASPSANGKNNSTVTATTPLIRDGSATPPHKLPEAFKFKDYMPKAFRVIRDLAGIEESQYMKSISGDFNFIEFIANSKSGQFFFYSHDGKYMIKTQTKEESKFLRRIMPKYVEHIFANPNSLLVRFYGMHRVKMDFLSSSMTIHFIVMSSVFDTDKPIHVKYDLKGSTVGRITKEKDCNEGAVQKDVNLIRSKRQFKFSEHKGTIFKETLESDTHFLASLNIMDYSLLVGIHETKNPKQPGRRPSGIISERLSHSGTSSAARDPDANIFQAYHGGIKSVGDSGEVYFLGIIDILQTYNASKRGETILKSMLGNGSQISAVSPQFYAQRFVKFLMDRTELVRGPSPTPAEIESAEKAASTVSEALSTSTTSSPVKAANGNNNNNSSTNSPVSSPQQQSKRLQSSESNPKVLISLQKNTSFKNAAAAAVVSEKERNKNMALSPQPQKKKSLLGRVFG